MNSHEWLSKFSVEYLRHRECKNSISIPRRHHNLFVNGIDLDSVHVHSRDFRYRDSPTRRDVSIIVNTPDTDSPACGETLPPASSIVFWDLESRAGALRHP